MIVLSVAYPFAPVSLDAAGGAEQVLAMLDRGLTRARHRSLVIAAEGSCVHGELLALPADPRFPDAAYARWSAAIRSVIDSQPVDLVHLHGVDFHRYLPPAGPPVLVTLHLPRSFYPESIVRLPRPNTFFNCVSQSQRASLPAAFSIAGIVENGVPLDLLSGPPCQPRPYVLAVSRICPEKGLHLAVDAAERAGLPLYLAGKVYSYPEHEQYWRTVLRPRLIPPHRFLGCVGIARKATLMTGARCLLVPSLVPETSSLVAMESLACGTPVIAFPSGALQELIEPGRTGFLVPDVPAMARAIGDVARLDRTQCRAAAAVRFSDERMVREYCRLYQTLRVCV
jgi:glycosyltransferase involved in cell wall biosynthesis